MLCNGVDPDSPGRVLVVDDEPDVRKSILEILTAGGLLAEGAASAEEALHKLKTGHVDVVLSDFALGGSDGGELLTTIGREYPCVVGVLFTGHGSLARASLEAKTKTQRFTILHKGAPPTKLAAVVQHAVERARLAATVQDNGRRSQPIPSVE